MIRQITHSESQKWDDYVLNHSQSQQSHLYHWRQIIEKCFGHSTFYLIDETDGTIQGLCPLVLQKSSLFGTHLISLPYLNIAGILAEKESVREKLCEAALQLADEHSADYVELRHLNSDLKEISFFDHKVTFLLDLPKDPEILWAQLKDKVRNQIRKGEKEGLEFQCVDILTGLDSFYHLFSINMRNLGTPVLPKSFFLEVANQFKEKAQLFICTLNGKPLATGFTLIHQNKMEIPWAASDWNFLSKAPNMFLYWGILKWASQQGIDSFDFGRCSKNAGTYHFKKQWGATEVPLYWYHHSKKSSKLEKSPKPSLLMQWGSSLWRYLPLCVTERVGPKLAKNLPF